MSANRILIVAAVLCLSGCGTRPPGGDGDADDASIILDASKGISESGNTVVKVLSIADALKDSVTAKAVTDGDTVVNADVDADVDLTSAFVVLKSIKFYRNGGPSGRTEHKNRENETLVMKGPFIVDLLRGTVTSVVPPISEEGDEADELSGRRHNRRHHRSRGNGEISGLELPEGSYDRFKIKLEPLELEDAPSADHPLVGLSMHAVGSVNGVAFEYCGSFRDNLEFRVPEGVVVNSDGVAELGLVLNPQSWFVDLAELAPTAQDGLADVPEAASDNGPCDGDVPCRQWATNVVDFSSEYSSPSWSATQALDQPNTMGYGDFITAWAAQHANGGPEFLTVDFDVPVYATGVVVRETWGNGFVRRIEAVDELGTAHVVWEDVDASQPGTPVDFLVNFPQTDFLVHGVTVHVDPNHNVGTWEEVDAVELLGRAAIDPPDTGATILVCGEENVELQESIRRRMRNSARWHHKKHDRDAFHEETEDDHEERDEDDKHDEGEEDDDDDDD